MTIFSINRFLGIRLLLMTLMLSACNSDEEVKPDEAFSKVYHINNADLKLHPVSLIQNRSNGYLLLSAADEWNIHISKTDDKGEVDWHAAIDPPYVNPVYPLMEKDGQYYFFCMDEVSLTAYLVRIDQDNGELLEVRSYDDIIYPLSAATLSDGGFLLQSYNRNARSTQISRIDQNFDVVWQENYNVLEDVEEAVINHLTRRGDRLAFFAGEVNNTGNYYFNGFYNFSFSTVFLDAGDGARKGVLTGYRYEGAVSALSHVADSNFALSRYAYEENYYLPGKGLDQEEVVFTGDMAGKQLYELEGNAKVRIKKAGNTVIYGSTTKSRQVVLHFYDAGSGRLKGTRYFGETNPYAFADFIRTHDGGLAVLAKTFVADRFARTALFKLSKDEMDELGG